MTPLRIKARDGIYLSGISVTDKAALMEYIGSRDVYATTLNIPHPYLEEHADFWIQRRIEQTQRTGHEVTFAIRNADDKLIGSVSADSLEVGTTHRAEIGYWLGKPFWGQGIMTDAVRAYVGYAFRELGLLRITAHVFELNEASARVLEKNGFRLEGQLRKHFRKDGELFDARFYGLLKDDVD